MNLICTYRDGENNHGEEKHLGLRIDAETHKKLKSLAEFEGRSINGEVLYLIRQAIMEFEISMANRTKNLHI